MSQSRHWPGPGPWMIWIAMTLVQIGGCGFHLRGAVDVPESLKPLYLQAPASSALTGALRDQLAGGPVVLASTPAEARLILRILSEQQGSRVVAVDASGKALAHELRYLVRFDAVGKDGQTYLEPRTLDLVRTFDNPEVEVLGKQLEEQMIFQDFAIDAADRILMQLRTLAR